MIVISGNYMLRRPKYSKVESVAPEEEEEEEEERNTYHISQRK